MYILLHFFFTFVERRGWLIDEKSAYYVDCVDCTLAAYSSCPIALSCAVRARAPCSCTRSEGRSDQLVG